MSPRAAAPDLDQRILRLWQRARPVVDARLQVLARAAAAATTDQLEPALRHDAIVVAHKLAGSLGSYGIPAGSDLASAIEHELECDCDSALLSALVADLREVIAASPPGRRT